MDRSTPIIVTEHLYASPEEVWKAITEQQQMVQWYFDTIADFKAEVGFETRFNVQSGERNFLHVWKVTDVVPGEKITYRWQYPEYSDGESYTTFDLTPHAGGTRITVTSKGFEHFPDDIPEFEWESGYRGWKYFIQERLSDYLRKQIFDNK